MELYFPCQKPQKKITARLPSRLAVAKFDPV